MRHSRRTRSRSKSEQLEVHPQTITAAMLRREYRVQMRCRTCNRIWYASPRVRQRGGQCPICLSSNVSAAMERG